MNNAKEPFEDWLLRMQPTPEEVTQRILSVLSGAGISSERAVEALASFPAVPRLEHVAARLPSRIGTAADLQWIAALAIGGKASEYRVSSPELGVALVEVPAYLGEEGRLKAQAALEEQAPLAVRIRTALYSPTEGPYR